MTDRVRLLKQESAATGGNGADDVEWLNTPGNPNQDAPDVRGVYLQNDTSNDTTAVITRDASNNITLTDSIAGTWTLSQLSASGANFGSTTVDFGFATGLEDGNTSILVTGQPWVTATSKINAWPQGSSLDHDAEDAILEGIHCTID